MTTATEASTTVRIAHTEADVRACYPVMAQLRPHLDEERFVEQVFRQEKQGYRLAYLSEGSTVHAVLEQHALEPVPSVRSLRSAVPPGVERTITKALAKAPADRFPEAGQMADALEAASK